MHDTIWCSLPSIATSLGVKQFKEFTLELFLPPLFADLKCGHQLAEAEARACISKLRDLVGSRIFVGRLDPAQQETLATNSNILPPQQLGTGLAAGMLQQPTGMLLPAAAAAADRVQPVR
jgi:hypothetical protein